MKRRRNELLFILVVEHVYCEDVDQQVAGSYPTLSRRSKARHRKTMSACWRDKITVSNEAETSRRISFLQVHFVMLQFKSTSVLPSVLAAAFDASRFSHTGHAHSPFLIYERSSGYPFCSDFQSNNVVMLLKSRTLTPNLSQQKRAIELDLQASQLELE
ncbi:hypothetical protein TNIN_261251 [Trichonephila inaurata madagascariensis]|uniref:Uncharacterized protein n=1 Tax=Trichonephila inaurata madagascariensis TaxID=2747483 RepID=A0A8X6KCG4_9ARAC|nr:hypothetical protein TNIN_261251 [Trichonephila inaurata madagascariensis]